MWVADLALLLVTLIWGVTFPVVKTALDAASPLCFNAARMSLAAGLLLAVYRPAPRRLTPALWGAGATLGFCLAAGYALQSAGLALTTSSKSAFITSFSVILVPLLLAGVWRRKLGGAVWWGTALALAGLYFLVAAPGAAAALRPGAGDAWGEALTGVCALAFAFQIVFLGEWAPRFRFGDLATLQIGFAALFTWIAIPALADVEPPRWHSRPELWLAVVATAVLATALAFTVQTWAQQFTPATHTAVIFASEPVFAWLASTLGWHEHLLPVQLAGAAMIVAAMLVVERGQAPAAAAPGL